MTLEIRKSKLLLEDSVKLVLFEVEKSYEEYKEFTSESIQLLNTIFKEMVVKSLDVLDRYIFVEYQSKNKIRSIYRISSKSQEFYLQENINFCTCDFFSNLVLKQQEFITCHHILAFNLAKIVKRVHTEIVEPSQLTNFLNYQISDIFN